MKKNKPFGELFDRSLKKTLLIMRIAFLLLVLGVLQASAIDAYAQKTRISINFTDAKLISVLDKIEEESEFFFLYNEKLLDTERKVSIVAENQLVSAILDKVLEGTDAKYTIIDRKIIISPESLNILAADGQQQKKISGIVTDKTGQSLPGVNVQVKGTTLGAITDAEGKYSIDVPAGSNILVFSFIGMQQQEVVPGAETEINVVMVETATALDEVIVVGYGTRVKSAVTGSISSVSKADIQSMSPGKNVAAELQGRVAGVYVTAQSGAPGSGSNIYLRGPISISGGKPLYIVDGNPVDDLNYNFNMSDIESINVLKDASAAAIYGAKAANGVILVTTKRGGKTKPVISFNANYGIRNVINLPTLFNRDQFIAARQLFGTNVTDLYGAESNWSSLPDTDWLNEWYKPGTEQNYDLSMSGGGDISTFYISGNYNRTEGNYLDNWIERYTLRVNSDHHITKKLKLTQNAYFLSGGENPVNAAGNGLLTFRSQPVMAIYDPANLPGGFAKVPKGFQGSNNVARALTDHTRYKSTVVNLSGALDYEPIKNLHLNAFFGTNLSYIDGYSYQYPYDDGAFAMLETFSDNNTKNQSFIATYTLNYSKEFNGHTISGLLGYEARRADYRWVQYSNRDSYVDEPQSASQAYGNANLTADFKNTNVLDRILSQFARLEYGYKGKYLLTANIRRDGYGSKFGPENRYGIFPGMSAGWVISKEKFMNQIEFLSTLKLRTGYGILGNAVGQDFAYSQYYEVQNSYDWSVGGAVNRTTGLDVVSQLANPNIQWESVATSNVGFDASFWKDRLIINFDYYSRQTNDMLYNVQLSPSAGVGTTVPANIGKMSNKGVEFNIEHRNEVGRFTYFVAFNGGFNKNELISLDPSLDRLYIASGNIGTGESGQGFYGLVNPCRSEPGLPLGQFYGLKTTGIYDTDAATGTRPTYSGYTPQSGDLIYVDQNLDGKITTADNVYIGNPWPKFTYGLSMGGTWNNFDVRFLFNGVYGNDIYNATESWEHVFFSDYNSTDKMYENSFFGTNGLTSVPFGGTLSKPDRNKNWGALSDYHVQDGSYLRLKNIQIGYNVPTKLLTKLHISSMKLTASADNLFVLTKYKGMDPEIPAQSLYGGILSQGLDFTSQRYPLSSITSFGIKMTF